MTKARLHPSLLELNGAMGDMVFRKRNGKTYVSMKPQYDETREPSRAQRDCRQVFKQAREYSKTALPDETLRAFYERLTQGRATTPHAVCMGDYLNQPTMDELDLSDYQGQAGNRILITTCDDVGVVQVDVTLTTIDGTTIEKGKAVEPWTGSGQWEYIATVSVAPGTDLLIEAEACDRPGSRAVRSANLTVGMN